MAFLSTKSATTVKSHQDRNISTGENTRVDKSERKGGQHLKGQSCLCGMQPSISNTSGQPSNLFVSALFFIC